MSISGRALSWIDPGLFAETMLSWEMQVYRTLAGEAGVAFFDRGIPDVLGYLRLQGLAVAAHMTRAAATLRYNRRVFIAPPWPEIFVQDRERKQTMQEAEQTYNSMVGIYADCGYELVEIPRSPVDDRVRFVLGSIA